MGKLHGIMIGAPDICSTLHHGGRPRRPRLVHRPDHAERNPAYLMALPTKNDAMLRYLTTAFQDHVRVREKFGFEVNDPMWSFFRDTLEVIDAAGQLTEHFARVDVGDLKFMRARTICAATRSS